MKKGLISIAGGCLCGALRYEATAAPFDGAICHCGMCRRSTGSLFGVGVMFNWPDFHFVQGEPKYYRSSRFAERGFCSDCGSPLIFRAIEDEWLSIQTGTLDDPEVAPPSGHYGIEGKISWLSIEDDLPRQRTEDDEWYQQRSSQSPSD